MALLIYWVRELTALGHTVRLVPPQYVKPYVKRGKNDRNDAEAICEAAGRPGMHFVPAKSVMQQAQGIVLKVRETLIGQRTALINTVRGHAAEFGVIAGKGVGKIVPLLFAIEQEAAIPPGRRRCSSFWVSRLTQIDARIKDVDAKLTAAAQGQRGQPTSGHHPGRGPGYRVGACRRDRSRRCSRSGRHLAAWVGLTPKERSTGGKQRMGGITRAANERLRVLLVSGATGVINAAMRPGSQQMTEWLQALLLRKPRNFAAVALANKMARTVWAMMKRGETYGAKCRLAGRCRTNRTGALAEALRAIVELDRTELQAIEAPRGFGRD